MTSVLNRRHGLRFELLRTRPHDHMGWVFRGAREFAALAIQYLAEGAALGERLMYVAQDPDPDDLGGLASVLHPDTLRVASIAEVYGQSGIVDPAGQRATFAAAVASAMADGYTGIRVVADNTPLVADEERLKAWIRWEVIADRFVCEHQVTGLCAFDQDKVDVDKLRHLATLHPLSSASSPAPQFRLFADAGDLCIEGELDSFAVTQLRLALDSLPAKTGVVVDLATVRLVSGSALAGLTELSAAGIPVTIRGQGTEIGALQRAAGRAADRLVLQEV